VRDRVNWHLRIKISVVDIQTSPRRCRRHFAIGHDLDAAGFEDFAARGSKRRSVVIVPDVGLGAAFLPALSLGGSDSRARVKILASGGGINQNIR